MVCSNQSCLKLVAFANLDELRWDAIRKSYLSPKGIFDLFTLMITRDQSIEFVFTWKYFIPNKRWILRVCSTILIFYDRRSQNTRYNSF